MSEEQQELLGGKTPEPMPNWRDHVPEDLRGSSLVQKHDTITAFVEDAVNAQSLIGKKGIPLLDETSTIQDHANFYRSTGRPESPEGYELDKVGWPENVPRDDAFMGSLVQRMYDAGASKRVVQEAYKAYGEGAGAQVSGMAEATAEQRAAAEATIKQEWGAAYDDNRRLAENAFTHIFGDAAKLVGESLTESGLPFGSEPAVWARMAEIGKQMQEDGFLGDKDGGSAFALSPADAKAEINSLMTDAEFNEALTNADHPGHKAAVERRSKLYEMAYPNKEAA